MSYSNDIFEKLGKSTPVIAILASVLAGLGSFFFENNIIIDEKVSSVIVSSSEVSSTVIDLSSQIENIKAQLEGIKTLPEDISVSSKIVEIEAKIQSLDNRLNSLQKSILDSPEKALSLPLIRRDIDALQKQHISAIANVEKEVSRAYDIFKWVTGSVVLGIVSLAFGVFIKQKE